MKSRTAIPMSPAFMNAQQIPSGSLANDFSQILLDRGGDVYAEVGHKILAHDAQLLAHIAQENEVSDSGFVDLAEQRLGELRYAITGTGAMRLSALWKECTLPPAVVEGQIPLTHRIESTIIDGRHAQDDESWSTDYRHAQGECHFRVHVEVLQRDGGVRVSGWLKPEKSSRLPGEPIFGTLIVRPRDGSTSVRSRVRLNFPRGAIMLGDGMTFDTTWMDAPVKELGESDVLWVPLSNRQLFIEKGIEADSPALDIAVRLISEREFDKVLLGTVVLQAKTLARKAVREAKQGEQPDYDGIVRDFLVEQRQPYPKIT